MCNLFVYRACGKSITSIITYYIGPVRATSSNIYGKKNGPVIMSRASAWEIRHLGKISTITEE